MPDRDITITENLKRYLVPGYSSVTHLDVGLLVVYVHLSFHKSF